MRERLIAWLSRGVGEFESPCSIAYAEGRRISDLFEQDLRRMQPAAAAALYADRVEEARQRLGL